MTECIEDVGKGPELANIATLRVYELAADILIMAGNLLRGIKTSDEDWYVDVRDVIQVTRVLLGNLDDLLEKLK